MGGTAGLLGWSWIFVRAYPYMSALKIDLIAWLLADH